MTNRGVDAIAFAGGGTGGHVVPGLHLLERMRLRGTPPERVLWFGAGRAIEDRVLGAAGDVLDGVQLERVALRLEPDGGGAPSLARLLRRTLPEVVTARRALRRHGSRLVVGLGGYTTLPVALAARSAGVPLVLLEINAVAGRATRMLAPLATRVFHAWPSTVPPRAARHPGRHVHVGPPLAAAFARGGADESERVQACRTLGFDAERPLLVVLGGSQGARSLNAFARAHAAALVSAGVQVLHQAGPERSGEGANGVGDGYRCVEYLADVATALAAATLVLSRGGASTLAEIAARRSPAVVVPYPHHADRHQERNARLLGAGVRIVAESELDEAFRAELVRLASADGAGDRGAMIAALEHAVPTDASERICLALGTLL